jgi:hypothetical protein
MKDDEPADPVHVRALGAAAVVPHADGLPHAIEQLRRRGRAANRQNLGFVTRLASSHAHRPANPVPTADCDRTWSVLRVRGSAAQSLPRADRLRMAGTERQADLRLSVREDHRAALANAERLRDGRCTSRLERLRGARNHAPWIRSGVLRGNPARRQPAAIWRETGLKPRRPSYQCPSRVRTVAAVDDRLGARHRAGSGARTTAWHVHNAGT